MPIQIFGLRPNRDRTKVTAQWIAGRPILAESLSEMYAAPDKYLALIPQEERYNVFYTVAHHVGAGAASYPTNRKETFERQEALIWDLDHIDTAKKEEYVVCVSEALGLGAESFTTVSSGNGLHFILFLDEPIESVEFFRKNRPHYVSLKSKIEEAIVRAGLPPAKIDSSMFDPVQLLRLPGTENRKPIKDSSGALTGQFRTTQCSLRDLALTPVKFLLSTASGLGDLENNLLPSEIRRRFPKVDATTVLQGGCRFLQWFLAHPEEVHEPQAFDAMGLLAFIPGSERSKEVILGKTEAVRCEHLGRTLTEKTISQAVNSASLQTSGIEQKWEQACKYGGRRCSTIEKTDWEGSTRDPAYKDGCRGCAFYQLIDTPLEIRSDDFIATEDTGFWTIDKKGRREPAYKDLLNAFCEQPYIVSTHNKEVFQFVGTHYAKRYDTEIFGWIESRMNPDPQHCHRVEFLNKVRSNYTQSDEESDHFFYKSVEGKMNVQNGVLDIRTGELMPHSPQYGFRAVLPYRYDPDAQCPRFLAWLDEITLSRADLQRTLTEVMAYCLWPGYPDQCFVFLVGDGANGKSTYIRIIREMLGDCYTSGASISQLLENRFMGSTLDGKLANLSNESGGRILSPEAVARLKEFTGGDKVLVEVKHGHPYLMRNNAKLIFACNEPPKFGETNEALLRREILVPFEFDITKKKGGTNPQVENEILENEMPGILALCVKTIQRMYQESGESLRVFRGGKTMEDAKEQHMIEGSNVLTWFESHCDVTNNEKDYVPVQEAYDRYKLDVKNAVTHLMRFATPINKIFITKRVRPDLQDKDRAYIGGARCRVWRGVKFRGEGSY